MEIFLCSLKTLVAYILMMLIGTNLLGTVVRGLKTPTIEINGELYAQEDITSIRSILLTIFFSLITLSYLFSLYYFWNLGVFLSGLILMITRLPDLLHEIKYGVKINLYNMPQRPIDIIFNIIGWLVLPFLWISFCYWENI